MSYNPTAPRVCVFCGGRPLTKEHLWPKWMGEAFPAMNEGADHFRTPPGGGPPKRWSATPFSRTVRALCRPCNNGWMSEIERRTKPLLLPLFLGDSVELDPERQTILATWVMGKVLVHAYAEIRPNPIPRSHYDYYYAHKRPPAGTAIWLGAHTPRVYDDGRSLVLQGRAHPIQPRPGVKSESIDEFYRVKAKAYGLTLGFGDAAFQLFGSDYLDAGALPPSDDARPALRRIWPAGPRTTWPPPIRLTAAIGDLSQLHLAFISSIAEEQRDRER